MTKSKDMAKQVRFDECFGRNASVGDSITVESDGFTVTANLEFDEGMGFPWIEHDGHGPVTDWTTRRKRPGERILNENRGSYRYYDFQTAVKIARRDGWDADPIQPESRGERAARAAEADFQYLRAWCRDEWCFVGVVLKVSKAGVTLDPAAASLWGIESNSNDHGHDYLTEVANELLPEALENAKQILRKLCA